MNQILSVEMQNNKRKTAKTGNGKASTKSVLLFFSIVLIVFGIALAAVGIYTSISKNNQSKQISNEEKPTIDVTQDVTRLNIDITGTVEISEIEYRWSNDETHQQSGDGKTSMELNIDIPTGTNMFELTITDINGNTTEYSNEFVGPKKPNVRLVEQEGNKIQILCEEEQVIKTISYRYDDEEETKQEINDVTAQIDIAVKEGEHKLTIIVVYADDTVGAISNKLYVPTVKVTTDGNNFIINASDVRKITNVSINMNGTEENLENLDTETFEKVVPLQSGENRLILTVYNSDRSKFVKKIRWEKSN